LAHHPRQKHILLVGDAINHIDLAGIELLEQEAKRLKNQGGALYMAKLKAHVVNELKNSTFFEHIEYYPSKAEAIQKAFLRLDKTRCQTCTERVFFECEARKS
jgi:SulP family sulfate permease